MHSGALADRIFVFRILVRWKGTKTNKQGDTYEIDEYRYRKVMHGEKEGGRTNEILFPNPDPNDPDPMCIAKRVRHDEKDNFENKPLSWRYPKK